jgi:hypothetical protein
MRKQALDSGFLKRMPREALNNTLPLLKIGSTFLTKAAAGGLLSGLSQRAKDILGSSPQQQTSEINKLQSQSSSWAPEIGAGIAGGLTAGGTGAGLSYLANQGVYDPELVKQHITLLRAGKKSPLSQLTQNWQASGVPDYETTFSDQLNKFFGKAPTRISKMLPSAIGDEPAEKLLARASEKGIGPLFRGLLDIRKGGGVPRGGAGGLLGAGLLGLGGLGLAQVGRNYLGNVIERHRANSTLNELTNYAKSQQGK